MRTPSFVKRGGKCLKKRLNGIIVHPLKDFSEEVIHDIIENNKKSCKTGLYYSSSLFCFSNSTNF